MTDIKHDPELPYAVISLKGELRARFARHDSARKWRGANWPAGEVIDTTPVPPYKSESVLFRSGYVPIIRQDDGEWWFATGEGVYDQAPYRLTDADVREGVKTEGWKVFYQGEPVE